MNRIGTYYKRIFPVGTVYCLEYKGYSTRKLKVIRSTERDYVEREALRIMCLGTPVRAWVETK